MVALGAAALLMLTGAQPSTIDAGIAAMPIDTRLAQLLFVGVEGQVFSRDMGRLAGRHQAGGVVLFAHNVDYPEQLRRLNAAIAGAGGDLPSFIAIDQEGGIVRRVRQGVPTLPSNLALGAARSPELARRAGLEIGSALRELGFTMNFAPVLDVLSDPRNDAIGTRAFAGDPRLAGLLGAAYTEGQIAAGVLPVGKHFPGVGGVPVDTHNELPVLDRDAKELHARELVPFQRAFAAGLPAVMTGHIALPRVTGDNTPATLAPRILTRLLRQELRFRGIVISDALQMDALDRTLGSGELAVRAILAGADMLLAIGPKEREEVFAALRKAHADGRLTDARIAASLRRILAAKRAPRPATLQPATTTLADDVARAAVTLLPRGTPLVPLPAGTRERIHYSGPEGPLRDALQPKTGIRAKDASAIVAVADNDAQFDAARHLRASAPNVPFVLISTGSPRRILDGPGEATILTYSDGAAAHRAAADVLLGTLIAKGTLPVARARNVVWVGAHPDDELCAAPLLASLCREEGTQCRFVVLTGGERGACRLEGGCGELAAT